MVDLNISSATASTIADTDYSDQTKDGDFYNGGSTDTDGVNGNSTSWINDWAKWHNYYIDIPLFAESMDTLASWSVGRGFKANNKEKEKLRKIRGWGKDDFNTIIENLIRTMLICGDSFAEIVRDKAGRLTNLKPLNPSRIKINVDEYGIIKNYEQIDPRSKKAVGKPYNPKEIFHLSWNRLADEIHGKSYAERGESIIKQIKQLQEDLGIRFHRIVKPIRLYEANTDDTTELTALEAKLATAYKKADHIVIPKGSLALVDEGKNLSAIDAITYANDLIRSFVTSCGVPEVILGWSVGTTEASAKIVYLAYQQRIERIQKFVEENLIIQVGIEINFEFPASLEPALTEGRGGAKPKVNTPSKDNQKAGKLNNINKK